MGLKKSINILKTLSEDKQLSREVRNAILQGAGALRKQVPKVPEYEGDECDDNRAYCPYCRNMFDVDYDAPSFCPVCGQALDWSIE